jgi:anti-sigma factor RsiW
MNCRRFQDQVFEYVEGSLSARARAAAEEHLAGCPACREAVRQEEALRQRLARRLRQGAESLKLSPEIRRNLLAAARREPASPALSELIAGWWARFALPLSAGVAVLMLGAILWLNHLIGPQPPGGAIAQRPGRDAASAVSVEWSSRVPTYQFRREGNAVVDTLSVQTVSVNVTLRP